MPHQRILRKLLRQLCRHTEDTGLGEVLPAPVAMLLSDTDVVEPDLVVVLWPNASVITRERIDGAPDVVVEILSPSTAHRDRGLKLDQYQRSGIAEYWIADTELRVVHQYVLEVSIHPHAFERQSISKVTHYQATRDVDTRIENRVAKVGCLNFVPSEYPNNRYRLGHGERTSHRLEDAVSSGNGIGDRSRLLSLSPLNHSRTLLARRVHQTAFQPQRK